MNERYHVYTFWKRLESEKVMQKTAFKNIKQGKRYRQKYAYFE